MPVTLDKTTKISVGLIVVAITVVQPVVSAAIRNLVDNTERNTRVDMTLSTYGSRLEKVEKRQEYMYDALRRLEQHFGTLPKESLKPNL